MNPVDTSQHFKRGRRGRFSSASRKLICALKLVLARSSRSRRPGSSAAGLTQLLEVRQVLSTTNPIQHLPVESGESLPVDSDTKGASRIDLPPDLPAQLKDINSITGMISGNDPGLSATASGASISWDGRIPSDLPSSVDPLNASVRISSSDTDSLKSEDSGSLGSAVISPPAVETPMIRSDSISLIDEVFSLSPVIPDGASPSSMMPADGGSSVVPLTDSQSKNLFRYGHAQAAPVLLAARSLGVAPSNAAFIDYVQERSRTFVSNVGSVDSSRLLKDGRIFYRPGSSKSEWSHDSNSVRLDSVVCFSASSEQIGSAEHWIAWLSGSDTEGELTAHQVMPQTTRVLPKLPASHSSQTLRSQSGYAAEHKPASSSVPQTQSRRLREAHRQSSWSGRQEWISRDEFEPPALFRQDHQLVQLNYVANPRGPPIYGRDANIPLVDPETPADLLERLRYSITPRGPSLVTVETQSSEFLSFSGPGVSPEKLSIKLAC